MYTVLEVEGIINMIDLKESERLEVLQISEYTDGRMTVELRYTNKRANHIYQLHIEKLPEENYELFTLIKREHNGKNVDRSKNTTVVTANLIDAFRNNIRETLNKDAYPDSLEMKRILKYLDTNSLFYEIFTNWLSKESHFQQQIKALGIPAYLDAIGLEESRIEEILVNWKYNHLF